VLSGKAPTVLGRSSELDLTEITVLSTANSFLHFVTL
jgi:hypothetical protein